MLEQVARDGFVRMAISGCYGEPNFPRLIGLGLGTTYMYLSSLWLPTAFRGTRCRCDAASLPAREVEEEEKSEIDWAWMIDEEAQDLNAADQEKQSCA